MFPLLPFKSVPSLFSLLFKYIIIAWVSVLYGRYLKNTHMYFHEPKASENTSMRESYPPYCTVSVINCLLYDVHWIFFQNSKIIVLQTSLFWSAIHLKIQSRTMKGYVWAFNAAFVWTLAWCGNTRGRISKVPYILECLLVMWVVCMC